MTSPTNDEAATETETETETETPPTPESLLQDLKDELGSECEGVNDEYLLPFLRWKPCVKRASARYREFIKWKAANKGLFDESLRLHKDPELERLVLSEVIVCPAELKTREGGPILIGRFRFNDMTDGRTVEGVCRTLFYTIDQILQRPEAQEHGLTVIHDLRGFDKRKNARFEVARSLFRMYGHLPLQLKAIYICSASTVFLTFFKVISRIIMTAKLRRRVHFINDFKELDEDNLGVVDPKDLLTDLGGTLDYSVKDWVEEQKRKEQSGADGEWKSFTEVNPTVAEAEAAVEVEAAAEAEAEE